MGWVNKKSNTKKYKEGDLVSKKENLAKKSQEVHGLTSADKKDMTEEELQQFFLGMASKSDIKNLKNEPEEPKNVGYAADMPEEPKNVGYAVSLKPPKTPKKPKKETKKSKKIGGTHKRAFAK